MSATLCTFEAANMLAYNPSAWFWRADDGRIYSSATRAIVSEEDEAFTNWSAAGGTPTIWPRDDAGHQTDASLKAVLDAAGAYFTSSAITYKADIYRRASDEEAEAIETALMHVPVRQRRLFESALHLDHAAPEFAQMKIALEEMFGSDRAAELLSPSS
ncbi:hypothetical protein FF100_04980 [Methylobacterium terricola]|uniref:DUF4376 domain-containing protein n=1 Tax=Methylobacterium terricola TaxID=2583531 RepID=A0A5C4LQ09_9HYPH|nr:hypothetical protein [Methylobacterium terricola]TNC14932.1 hypothetical protein FF100_04980 [Methylobacterium terricola]